ncbi:MAG TPA: FecR family protein [Kofleriaceae bacterium]|nr:FecR family protein [Kofleriaceae bacterium]
MTDQRLGPPPIEPLSDAAWARVERGVWAQLGSDLPTGQRPPGQRRWWLAVAPLAAAAAVVAVVIALRWQPSGLDEPSRVVSGPGPDPTSVMLGDSHIVLDPNTALVMRHEAEHPTVQVERGGAWFTVAPRGSRPAFIVRAGDATVHVVGTRFRVARSDERIAVEVERGLVDVNFRGSVVAVGAGQRWSSDAGRILATAAAPPAADPAPEVAAPEVAAPEVAAPAPIRHTSRPARPAVGSAVAPAEVAPAAPPAEVAGDRDQTEYDRLAALEPRSPATALAGYLKLARGTSRWADPALFAAARLAVDRGDRRAETLLGIYLQRFPGGANATDARQLLARLKAGP